MCDILWSDPDDDDEYEFEDEDDYDDDDDDNDDEFINDNKKGMEKKSSK